MKHPIKSNKQPKKVYEKIFTNEEINLRSLG